jgi:glycosyltransferase involved in cell wall biosynthesis
MENDEKPKALILASVASMIDQFNMQNIRLLLDNGYQVDVACNCKIGNTISDERVKYLINHLSEMNVKVTHVPIPREINDIKAIKDSYVQVKKMCDENKYDLLHCHSPIGSVVARLAARKARKHGTKVIYTAHGFHFYKGAPKKNWIIFYPIEKICSRWTDVLVTINKEDYAFAKKHMSARHVEYIPGIGVDTEMFKSKEFDRDAKRTALGISNNELMILSVGELNQNKNQEVIIKAISKLQNKQIHYFIVGKGNKEKYLMDLAKELNVNLHLLGYRTDVVEILWSADIFALPSYREGLSVALMEAMAAGLPCVASKIRGNVDLIDTNDGCLYRADDIEGFEKAIRQLSDDKSLRIKIGQDNRNKIKEFDVANVIDKMVAIYS